MTATEGVALRGPVGDSQALLHRSSLNGAQEESLLTHDCDSVGKVRMPVRAAQEESKDSMVWWKSLAGEGW